MSFVSIGVRAEWMGGLGGMLAAGIQHMLCRLEAKDSQVVPCRAAVHREGCPPVYHIREYQDGIGLYPPAVD